MNDLLLIPVIFLAVGGILILYGDSFLLPVDFSLLVLSVFLFSWRSMEFICSLLNRLYILMISDNMV